ncbi:MAG: hypothetical protein IKY83_08950 [Proteobacteria bacterium]|nr:hypothetical protein [Pseudomonadota bacterium]
MSEIVLYDANPTVRNILTEQFSTYGLSLVDLPALDRCELILQNCTHPAVIVLDMSRQPDRLPYLQSVIPRFINAPERCILTSTQPTTLAPYMPASSDQYFFKHVVERPFKRSEFFSFFESILKPYIASSKSIQLVMPHLSVNSSLSQITGQTASVPVDESLRKEVDIIVSSTSNAVILEDLAKASVTPDKAAPSPAVPKPPKRPARAAQPSADNQPRNARESSAPHYPRESSAPRFQRESSAPKQPSSLPPKAPAGMSQSLPKLPPPIQNKSLSGIPSIPRPAASATDLSPATRATPPARLPRLPSLQAPKIPASVPSPAEAAIEPSDEDCTHFIEADTSQTDDVEAIHVPKPEVPTTPPNAAAQIVPDTFDVDEENATQIATPALLEPLSTAPKYAVSGSGTQPYAQTTFSLYWLIDTLKLNILHNAQFTLVWHDAQDLWVAFIDNGKFTWFEKLKDGRIPDAAEYLNSQTRSQNLPIKDLVASAAQHHSLAQAFASLSLNMQAFDLSQNAVFSHFAQIRSLENKTVELFQVMPPQFLPLIQNRPVQPIDIFPAFFDLLRSTADQCLPPEIFNLTRFVRRAFRTHINASIQLTAEESDILLALHTPLNIPDLKRTGKRHVSDILYRLVLFEFVDFAI